MRCSPARVRVCALIASLHAHHPSVISNDKTTKFWARNRPGEILKDQYHLPYEEVDVGACVRPRDSTPPLPP